MSYKQIILLNVLSIACLIAIISLTTPDSYGLIFATLSLIFVYLFCATVIMLILKIAYPDKSMNPRNKVIISLVLGLILPMIIALNTIGSIKALDVVLVVTIPVVLVWYIQRRK